MLILQSFSIWQLRRVPKGAVGTVGLSYATSKAPRSQKKTPKPSHLQVFFDAAIKVPADPEDPKEKVPVPDCRRVMKTTDLVHT